MGELFDHRPGAASIGPGAIKLHGCYNLAPMDWLEEYQLFLFDFDGLLVNTEHLHMQAYERLAEEVGFQPHWDFRKYCSIAHRGLHELEKYFYSQAPRLRERFPDWQPLYKRKQALYDEVIREGKCALMPGAEELLRQLRERKISCAVVTHSLAQPVAFLRSQLPVLDLIPDRNWITRDQYPEPKPHPSGYLLALERHGSGAQKVVGFEDTPRGLQALRQTRAQPVLVCPTDYPLLPEVPLQGVVHLTSLLAIS
jgi:beta-phosphoglucomutase